MFTAVSLALDRKFGMNWLIVSDTAQPFLPLKTVSEPSSLHKRMETDPPFTFQHFPLLLLSSPLFSTHKLLRVVLGTSCCSRPCVLWLCFVPCRTPWCLRFCQASVASSTASTPSPATSVWPAPWSEPHSHLTWSVHNNNVHLSYTPQHPEHSHDTYFNLNTICYTHVEHRPTKTIYMQHTLCWGQIVKFTYFFIIILCYVYIYVCVHVCVCECYLVIQILHCSSFILTIFLIFFIIII